MAYDPGGGPLQLHAAVKVEDTGNGSIRERVEINAYFAGPDPMVPGAPTPTLRDIQLELEVDIAGVQQPCWIVVLAGNAWTALDGGDVVLAAEGPSEVENAVKVQLLEPGEPPTELTDRVAAVEARLAFRADLQVWELKVELTGAATLEPPVLAPMAGAARATLRIESDAVSAPIRENEAGWESDLVAATAGTMIRDAGPGEIRELVEVVARFPSAELVPDPQIREVEDIRLDFEVDIAGDTEPCWVFVIPGDAWEEGDGGGFKFEDHQPQWLQALVIREGQLLADLTGRIREVEANLTLLDGGVWELRLEIGGEAAPVEQHAPAFSPIAGAATATVVVENELELLPAGLREAEALFGIVTPSD